MCANLESLKCGIKVNNKLAKDFYDILKDCLNESFGKLLIRDLKIWQNTCGKMTWSYVSKTQIMF